MVFGHWKGNCDKQKIEKGKKQALWIWKSNDKGKEEIVTLVVQGEIEEIMEKDLPLNYNKLGILQEWPRKETLP